MLRYLPPVHFPLPLPALWSALVTAGASRPTLETRVTDWLGERFPNRDITLTDSGTAALALAILGSRAPAATPPLVALPAYGCPDLGAAAIAADARIVLYDVNPADLQPDMASVEAALARGATHVVVTHLYGRAANVVHIRTLASPFGAVVIEDAAQGADASWAGTASGNLAEWSILSLGRGKGYNAGGGGVLLAPRGQSRMVALPAATPRNLDTVRRTAITVGTQMLSHPLVYGIPVRIPALKLGETVFHALGTPGPISSSALSLVIAAFEASAAAAASRRAHEAYYLQTLADLPHVRLPTPHPHSVSGALRVPVRVDAARVIDLHPFGVVRSYPRQLSAYPEVTARIVGSTSLPGAAELASSMHTLPTHRHVRPADREYVVRVLRRVGATRS